MNEDQIDYRTNRAQILATFSIKLWQPLLKRPLDMMIPIAFSILLVGIFVAESTGIVLSAQVISEVSEPIALSKPQLRRAWDRR